MIAALIPLLLPFPLPSVQEAPTAAQLVDQGWSLIPAYDGSHRESLAPDLRRATAAAAHLFAAATELEPENLRAWWSLGHAEVLLAEDSRSRETGTHLAHLQRAEQALSRGMELAPEDAWAPYSRGAARVGLGDPIAGLADLDRAVGALEPLVRERGDSSSEAWLRFKCLEWRPEALMRAGRFDEARQALHAFHGEFSENAFPLHVALAECRLRERDLAGAREEYLAITRLFPEDPQAYALLGYVAGLLEDRATATIRLREALRRELVPGLYTRLWLWILATDEALPAARADLAGFVASPPSSLGEWDRWLGRFCLGEEQPEDFLAAARAERLRRLDAGESVDWLLAEVWFYVGLRAELDAKQLEPGAPREVLLERARSAYSSALSSRPPTWKWEWAFARLHLARLTTGTTPGPAPDLTGWREVRWHRPGTEGPVQRLEGLAVGDLLLGIAPDAEGIERFQAVPLLAP